MEVTLTVEEGNELTPRCSIRVVEKMAALSAAPPQAAARMPVKTKARKKVTAEKKKTPVKIRYDKDGNKIYVKFSDDSHDEDYDYESD